MGLTTLPRPRGLSRVGGGGGGGGGSGRKAQRSRGAEAGTRPGGGTRGGRAAAAAAPARLLGGEPAGAPGARASCRHKGWLRTAQSRHRESPRAPAGGDARSSSKRFSGAGRSRIVRPLSWPLGARRELAARAAWGGRREGRGGEGEGRGRGGGSGGKGGRGKGEGGGEGEGEG